MRMIGAITWWDAPAFLCGGIALLFAALLGAAAIFSIFNSYIRRLRLRWRGSWRQHRRATRGLGLGVDELARRLGITTDELRAFRPRYAERYIPKSKGGRRRLLVPDPATKQMQRRLLRRVFARLGAHPAACAFERGKSIVDAARPHAARAVVIKIDVVDFFDSTTAGRLDDYFRRIGWNAEAAAELVRLTTYDAGLPQGAPTSPRLSNLVNFYLDVQLAARAKKRKGHYTRYADDITFSFPKDYPKRVRGVVLSTKRILKMYGYRMHTGSKLRTLRRHQKQAVTGLIVNDKVNLPRKTKRWLRAARHRLSHGQQATLTPAQLKGWEAFEKMIAKSRDSENSR